MIHCLGKSHMAKGATGHKHTNIVFTIQDLGNMFIYNTLT